MKLAGTQLATVTVGNNTDVVEETEREECGRLCRPTRCILYGTDLLMTFQVTPPP